MKPISGIFYNVPQTFHNASDLCMIPAVRMRVQPAPDQWFNYPCMQERQYHRAPYTSLARL